MTGPIAVTGATGTVGSRVVTELLSAGAEVRVALRNPNEVGTRPGLETVALDLTETRDMVQALHGCAKLFLLTPFVTDMVAMSNSLVDAAKEAGVEHVVRLSAVGAGPDAAITLAKWHTAAELYLERSGLAFTHLRPNSFMQNYITFHGEAIRSQASFYLPHGQGSMSLVDARDVAAVAARALLDGGHAGNAYTLTGPSAIDNEEIARILSSVLKREIRYIDTSDDAARRALGEMGSPEALIRALMELNNIIRKGYTAELSPDVERVTGRSPFSFEVFARDHRDAWA
jgi:uncharacterized protein YbjT (DUF2867 family)